MKRQVSYYWWVYLLYSVIAIASVVTIYQQVESPDENEIIRIVIAGKNIDTSALEEALQSYLTSDSSQTIKQVYVEYLDLENYEEVLATRSLGGYDFVILPKEQIRANTGSFYFLPLNSIIEDLSGTPSVYFENDIPYGIILNPTGETNHFTTFIDHSDTETYVAFVNVFSVNIGQYNEYSNITDIAALEALIWLIEGENNE
ncbi:MAG: hypothetical protein ACVCEJ_04180 [Candidatus Izemoplasmataceae bacterium]